MGLTPAARGSRRRRGSRPPRSGRTRRGGRTWPPRGAWPTVAMPAGRRRRDTPGPAGRRHSASPALAHGLAAGGASAAPLRCPRRPVSLTMIPSTSSVRPNAQTTVAPVGRSSDRGGEHRQHAHAPPRRPSPTSEPGPMREASRIPARVGRSGTRRRAARRRCAPTRSRPRRRTRRRRSPRRARASPRDTPGPGSVEIRKKGRRQSQWKTPTSA